MHHNTKKLCCFAAKDDDELVPIDIVHCLPRHIFMHEDMITQRITEQELLLLLRFAGSTVQKEFLEKLKAMDRMHKCLLMYSDVSNLISLIIHALNKGYSTESVYQSLCEYFHELSSCITVTGSQRCVGLQVNRYYSQCFKYS